VPPYMGTDDYIGKRYGPCHGGERDLGTMPRVEVLPDQTEARSRKTRSQTVAGDLAKRSARWRSRHLVGVLLLLIGTACVGPSRTQRDYERKVANSAEAMVSSVQSALLIVETTRGDKSPGPYVSLHLSELEESAHAVETALGAVQPPDPALDELREEALTTIGDAGDVLEELRLAAYRSELHRLPEIARGLQEPLRHLERLTEIAPT
jgi:hypothetical protein